MAIPQDVPAVTVEREAALAVLRAEAAKVRVARPGDRNTVLNKAAFTCGGLVADKHLERCEVEDDLLAAVLKNDGDEVKDAAKITAGIEAGMGKPWTPTTAVRKPSRPARAGKSTTPPPVGRHREGPEGFETFERGDHTELSIALLGRLQSNGPELVHDEGALHRYDAATGLWQVVTEATQSVIVQAFAGVIVADKAKPLKVGVQDVYGAIRLAADRTMKTGFFEGGSRGLAFANGFAEVTADGITLRDRSPDHRARHGYEFDLRIGAVPKRALRFLKDVWAPDDDKQQKIDCFQEFGGIAMIGAGPEFQQCVVAVGKATPAVDQENGSNGKSQAGELLTGTMLAGWVTHVPPQNFENEYRRAMFAGKRLNIVGELPEADIIASESFKAVVGGDNIQARMIRERPFDFRPKASHFFSTNTLPGSNDLTFAFWRRWLVLTFNRTFRPTDPGFVQDIGKKIVADERAELASWFLAGAVRALGQKRYTVPQSHETEMSAWKRSANQVLLFLDEETFPAESQRPKRRRIRDGNDWKIRVEDDWVKASELYEPYRRWCEASGHKPMAANKLGTRLAQAGYPPQHTEFGHVYPLRLRCKLKPEQIAAAEAKRKMARNAAQVRRLKDS